MHRKAFSVNRGSKVALHLLAHVFHKVGGQVIRLFARAQASDYGLFSQGIIALSRELFVANHAEEHLVATFQRAFRTAYWAVAVGRF